MCLPLGHAGREFRVDYVLHISAERGEANQAKLKILMEKVTSGKMRASCSPGGTKVLVSKSFPKSPGENSALLCC